MLESTTNAMIASASSERLGVVAQRRPEDLQVLRRGVGADGDQDDVVEQDRPAGDERDELVEGVAGEHGGAAGLLVQGGALDVGHRGQPEHHRGDQEHERGEPERVVDDDPEREEHGARQRGVDDPEQDRGADRAARASPSTTRRARAARARPRGLGPLGLAGASDPTIGGVRVAIGRRAHGARRPPCAARRTTARDRCARLRGYSSPTQSAAAESSTARAA